MVPVLGRFQRDRDAVADEQPRDEQPCQERHRRRVDRLDVLEQAVVALLDEDAFGGVIDINDRVPAEVPAHWLVYFTVDDVEATVR